MMSPAPDPPISGYVELYENERRWVGGGFSKKGLFPAERGPFSTTNDGSLSWRTLDEAADALLGKGWMWPDDSQYEYDTPNDCECQCDENGWTYAVDFSPSHLHNACPQQGMTHFVRRRRIRRRKVFDRKQLAFTMNEEQCANCDSEALDALSLKLLETLAFATLLQRDAQHTLTDAVALSLKDKLIDALGIGSPQPDWSTKVDSSVRLQHLLEELDKFPRNQQNILAKACQARGTAVIKGLADRMVLVSNRYFGKDEREAFSVVVICQLDPECALHCGRSLCNNDDCDYYRVACPNKGCENLVSRKHLEWHSQGKCSFLIIECPNGCGDSFPKNQREAHLKNACGLRQKKCLFHAFGCSVVVPARELEKHVQENTNGHLLLAAKKMEEYQNRLNDMQNRVERLEHENVQLKATLSAKSEAHGKDVTRLEKQVKASSKHLTTLERKYNAEIRSHKK